MIIKPMRFHIIGCISWPSSLALSCTQSSLFTVFFGRFLSGLKPSPSCPNFIWSPKTKMYKISLPITSCSWVFTESSTCFTGTYCLILGFTTGRPSITRLSLLAWLRLFSMRTLFTILWKVTKTKESSTCPSDRFEKIFVYIFVVFDFYDWMKR